MSGKSTKVLVTGASGQLGSELNQLAASFPNLQFTFTDVAELDITSKEAVNAIFEKEGFDYCINCAAYTAVDKAESEKHLAHQINVVAVQHIAAACQRFGTRLFHFSTDFVFDGTKSTPLLETDLTAPLSVYGQTKLDGEGAAIYENDAIVFRTSWVYSEYGNNFVKTMLRLGKERDGLNVIYDQIGSPTYANDLALLVLQIIDEDKFQKGIYNYSNEGVASWYDFAQAVFEYAGVTCKLQPIETKEYPTPATRPHYSLLHKGKVKETFGIQIPHWRNSLQVCLKKLGE